MPVRRGAAGLGAQAQEACDKAVAVLWGWFERQAQQGAEHADLDGIDSLEAYRASLADSLGLLEVCRHFLEDTSELTTDEVAALQLVVGLSDAHALWHDSTL